MAIASKAKLHTPALRRGALIRELRVKNNLYQSDVASWINANYGHIGINMTQKRISSIEAGSDLRITEAFLLADCFGIELEHLRCFELRCF